MGRLSEGRTGGRLSSRRKVDYEQIDQLLKLAEEKNLKPPEKDNIKNALRTVGRVLNVGTAASAGALRGAIRKDESVLEGIIGGVRDDISFSKVIREDLGINPEGRAGKFGVGTVGFIADVVFDPLTYLTFGLGAGIKVGQKTLTKGGTQLYQKASKELIESRFNKFVKQGMSETAARQLAGRKVTGKINQLFSQVIGKRGLTAEATDEFIKAGLSEKTLNNLAEIGTKLIDEGGIKFAGRTLVRSKTLAKTPIGRAARRLGEFETIKTLKRTLGESFVADFAKHPKLVGLVERGNREISKATKGLIKSNKELFKGLDDKQLGEFFDAVFEKKLGIVKKSKEIQEEIIGKLNKLFPDMKIKNKEQAIRILDSLEDVTQKQVQDIRDKVDEIVRPLFEARKKMVKSGKFVETLGLQKGDPALKSLSKIDKLNNVVDGLKKQIKELRKIKGTIPQIGKKTAINVGGEITEKEAKIVANRIIQFEEQRLNEVVEKLSDKLLKLKKQPAGIKKATGKKLEQATPEETIIFAERIIKKLQDDLTTKSQLLGKVIDSRRIAKARQKGEKLVFEDKKLQEVSDKLFEGDNAITKRFAKLAGLSEEDAIKFYIPSKFKDRLDVKEFIGRNMSSPNLGFLKEFKGKEKNIIKNPFELYSSGQIDVVTARIKTDVIKSTIKNLGKQFGEMTAEEAAARGFKEFKRKGIGGEIKGWLPEAIHDELSKFVQPKLKTIDELAKATGFDYITRLFKGYVTNPFPGFHVRNITSNQFQNILKMGLNALNPNLQRHALNMVLGRKFDTEIITKTGKRIKLKKIVDDINKNSDILKQGQFGSKELLIEKGKKELLKRKDTSKFNPLSPENVVLKTGQRFGSAAEEQAKLVSILGAVMEGKSVKEGIKQAEEALFNYGKLTEFERSVMRRIIPFYTFTKKNAEFQIKMLATNPGRVAAQLKAIRGIGEAVGEPLTEEDIKGLPDFVLQNLGIKAGVNKFGQNTFFTGFGLPIEEFLGRFSGENGIVWNAVRDTLVRTNPIIKFPAERATGQDFFRNRPIAEITNAQSLVSMLEAMPDKVEKQLKKQLNWVEYDRDVYVDGKKVGKQRVYKANPFALHLFRNLPSSRIQSTVGFLSDEREEPILKALKFFTGVKGYSIDQEQQRFFNELDEKRELQDWLINMGVLKEFRRTFKRRSQQTE